MIAKDPSQRCQSAEDALWDLRPRSAASIAPRPDPAAEAAQAAVAKRKQRMRYMAILAVSLSLAFCATMLLPARPAPAPTAQPVEGAVTHIYPEDCRIAVKVADGKQERLEEIRLTPRYDKVFINDKPEPLDQVRLDDFVRVKTTRDASGRRITKVYAYRPELSRGRIKQVKADVRQLILATANQQGKEEELAVSVPPDLKITFNDNTSPMTISDLRPDNRILVRHIGREAGREAAELSVERVVATEGIIRDVQANRLALEVGKKMVVLPLRRFLRDCSQQLVLDRRTTPQACRPSTGRQGNGRPRRPDCPRCCASHPSRRRND